MRHLVITTIVRVGLHRDSRSTVSKVNISLKGVNLSNSGNMKDNYMNQQTIEYPTEIKESREKEEKKGKRTHFSDPEA